MEENSSHRPEASVADENPLGLFQGHSIVADDGTPRDRGVRC